MKISAVIDNANIAIQFTPISVILPNSVNINLYPFIFSLYVISAVQNAGIRNTPFLSVTQIFVLFQRQCVSIVPLLVLWNSMMETKKEVFASWRKMIRIRVNFDHEDLQADFIESKFI